MPAIAIDNRPIGSSHPTYVIAEMSANHGQRFEDAVALVHAAHEAGADAIKLQTYTPDTLTLDAPQACFRIQGGSPWNGRRLYDLYAEAFTPWEWQPRLMQLAQELGLHCFSSAFDPSSVDFLESMHVPAYKVASFELVDIPLLQTIAATGKPVVLSTGMATLAEIGEAVEALLGGGCRQLALLKCTSAYPAPPEEAHLRTIPHLAAAFDVPVGLSDHTLGVAVPVAAVALGAVIIEKHLTLSRTVPGPDSMFSLEPHEFRQMVEAVRTVERALGRVHYGVTPRDQLSRGFRRSLFVVRDMREGDQFTPQHVRSIRPGAGLHPRYLPQVLGQCASQDIPRGTPLNWKLVA
jgi:pseudaminic acid synthase